MTVTCPKCNTRFSLQSEKATSSNQTDGKKFFCPKCGTEQPVSNACISCKIIFSKYRGGSENKSFTPEGKSQNSIAASKTNNTSDIKTKNYPYKTIKRFYIWSGICGLLTISALIQSSEVTIFFLLLTCFMLVMGISLSCKSDHKFFTWFNYEYQKHPSRTVILGIVILMMINSIIMLPKTISSTQQSSSSAYTNVSSSESEPKNPVKIEKPGYFKSRKQYIACTEAIKDRLKSPTTAKFPSYGDIKDKTVFLEEYGIVNYYFYVDSQNGFGAMIRTNCRCIVRSNTDTIIGATADE
jgi:hypothetical protein